MVLTLKKIHSTIDETQDRTIDDSSKAAVLATLKWQLPAIGVKSFFPVGSAHVCDPPSTTTDVDWLILFSDKKSMIDYASKAFRCGWSQCGDYPLGSDTWLAIRKDNINLILTFDEKHYCRFVSAAALCKQLNLQSKEQRIAIHNMIISDMYDSAGPIIEAINQTL